jgi:RNA polymerase sigma-70 factor (ECF subfamily)
MPDEIAKACSREDVEKIYRSESRRVFATLVRVLGDFELAEEALHDAFAAAVEQWPRSGVPANPRAWLVSAGRFKAIDCMRRQSNFDAAVAEISQRMYGNFSQDMSPDDDGIEDDRLRLIFTCCHPALPAESNVPLTLREVCGLTTEEIARAFLVPPPTIAQRIVRAKSKIKSARIPYKVPERSDLPERLDGVLHVIYLVFTEGYSASFGQSLTRAELSAEAIRLGRLLMDLMPEPQAIGLVGLMLLQESRRAARADEQGDLILLEDQNRSLWNQEQIAEGLDLVARALSLGSPSAYTLQAAIAAVHAEAKSAGETDWRQIAALYDVLLRVERSPIVELNRAVAIAMRDGPSAGLALIDQIINRGDLTDYHLAYAARAELCRRMGKMSDAKAAYEKALALAKQEPERRFLENRLRRLTSPSPPVLRGRGLGRGGKVDW